MLVGAEKAASSSGRVACSVELKWKMSQTVGLRSVRNKTWCCCLVCSYSGSQLVFWGQRKTSYISSLLMENCKQLNYKVNVLLGSTLGKWHLCGCWFPKIDVDFYCVYSIKKQLQLLSVCPGSGIFVMPAPCSHIQNIINSQTFYLERLLLFLLTLLGFRESEAKTFGDLVQIFPVLFRLIVAAHYHPADYFRCFSSCFIHSLRSFVFSWTDWIGLTCCFCFLLDFSLPQTSYIYLNWYLNKDQMCLIR